MVTRIRVAGGALGPVGTTVRIGVSVFPGKEGSRAENVSCVIYNVRFTNRSWTPGPAAPADVRCHLYRGASPEAARLGARDLAGVVTLNAAP